MKSSRPLIIIISMFLLVFTGCGNDDDDSGSTQDEPSDDDTNDADDSGDDEADENVFTTDFVHQIRFTLSEEAFDQINQPERPEVHAAMEIDGETFTDLGLKLKGLSSYDTLDGKPAFTVDLNEWIKGTRYYGLKAFKLNNGSLYDPTRTHEWLAYALARKAGLLAPRVGWAEVYCNDVDLGLYILVEKHDDVMIAYRDPSQKETGVILNPEDGFVDFGIDGIGENVEETILAVWEEGPLPPDPNIIASIIAADEIISADPTETAAAELWMHIEQTAFLDYMAWEALSSHADGYINARNWRLFINGETYSMEWVPSGADNTWHTDIDVFRSGIEGENARALLWCLSLPSCRQAYAEHTLSMADRVESLDLATKYQDITSMLQPFIDKDSRAPFSDGEIENAQMNTEKLLTQGPSEAREQIYAEYPELAP